MATKFKVGDKVRRTCAGDGNYKDVHKGSEHVVSGVDDFGWLDLEGVPAAHNSWSPDFFELISETPSPVRSVTRTEIVPGVYGRINITGTYKGDRVTMQWVSEGIHDAVSIVGLNAPELRAASLVLGQLADALEGE